MSIILNNERLMTFYKRKKLLNNEGILKSSGNHKGNSYFTYSSYSSKCLADHFLKH